MKHASHPSRPLRLALAALVLLTLTVPARGAEGSDAPKPGGFHHLLALNNTTDGGPVNWYRWYERLHGYLGSRGGIWCSPETSISIHRDGAITADTTDAVCLRSVSKLHYPLPANAGVEAITLPVRHKAGRALSRRAFNDQIEKQLTSSAKSS